MPGIFRIGALLLLVAPGLSHAGEMEGTVRLLVGSMALVEAEGKMAVISATDATTIKSARSFTALGTGDRIRIDFSREINGVVIADVIEAEPDAHIHQDYFLAWPDVLRLREQGDDHPFFLADTRSKLFYDAGHVPGARSLPPPYPANIQALDLPDRRQLIVLYSGGPKDVSSHAVLRMLVAGGYERVKIIKEGYAGWAGTGGPVMVEPGHVRANIKGGIVLIDARTPEQSASGRIDGAVALPAETMRKEDLFSQYWERPVVFYGDDDNDVRASGAAQKAIAWGYHQEAYSNAAVGILRGGLSGWRQGGGRVVKGVAPAKIDFGPEANSGELSFEEFRAAWAQQGKGAVLLEVAGIMEDQLPWVTHIRYTELHLRLGDLPKDREIFVFCPGGYRAMIAYHILRANGFRSRFLKRDVSINPDGTLQ